MMRIAYCGFDYYANCLEFLLQNVQVLKIFTAARNSERIVSLAREHHIPFQTVPVDQEEIDRLFTKENCDYIISAGYTSKIPIGKFRGLNIHPTLLPVGRGAWPFPRVILEGYDKSGVTIHKLIDKFDAGDIVLQKSFPLDPRETQDTLICKTQIIGMELVKTWLEKPEELWRKAIPQEDSEYWKKLGIGDRTLDLTAELALIDRTVRAFGSTGVRINIEGKQFFSNNVNIQIQQHSYPPGQIIYHTLNWAVIAIKDGFLYAVVNEVKPPDISEKLKNRIRRVLVRYKESWHNAFEIIHK